MNPYNFALLFFSFCTFLIGILIWLKRQDRIAKFYLFFSIVVSAWGVCWSIVISDNASYGSALLCARLTHAIGGLIGTIWFHVCLVIRNDTKRYRTLLPALYLISFVFMGFFLSPWFVPELVPAVSFQHYTRSGILLDLYWVIFFAGVILGFVELQQEIKLATGEKRFQLQGLFIATLLGFIGGSAIMLPIYGIMIPQYNLFLVPFYPFVMAYFMIRHRLFDVEQAIESFQREKLATIGLIASSINHEIRNPLYAAKCVLENYLEEEKETGNPLLPVPFSGSEQGKASEKALKQISRALDVITKLNRFAKPAEGAEVGGQGSRASVQEALKNVLDLISYEFALDKIHIINKIQNDLPDIQADQRQLEEILFNLIVNACHAMGKSGGELVIGVIRHCDGQRMDRKQSLGTGLPRPFGARNDGFIQITISDSGTGISPDQAKHLFEPFHTTKGEKGTGLGLYITKQLVERNNGKICVKSQSGEGTTMMLSFPLAICSGSGESNNL